jgi:hypothetical protein
LCGEPRANVQTPVRVVCGWQRRSRKPATRPSWLRSVRRTPAVRRIRDCLQGLRSLNCRRLGPALVDSRQPEQTVRLNDAYAAASSISIRRDLRVQLLPGSSLGRALYAGLQGEFRGGAPRGARRSSGRSAGCTRASAIRTCRESRQFDCIVRDRATCLCQLPRRGSCESCVLWVVTDED